jgi:quercetin dioxygenase-like cupin family protein
MRNRQSIYAIAAVTAALAGSIVYAQTAGQTMQPVEVKYAPSPFGEGAVLSGPLDKPVLYTQRVHLKAGGLVPPHTHPDTRYTTVLSGTLYVCTSDNVSAETAKAFPAGSFVIMPAGVVHCSWAKDGEVTYQESGVGPTATNMVKK